MYNNVYYGDLYLQQKSCIIKQRQPILNSVVVYTIFQDLLLQSPLFNAPTVMSVQHQQQQQHQQSLSQHQLTPQHHSTPAFRSLFPRSLSAFNLGTRKKVDKDPLLISTPSAMSGYADQFFRPIQSIPMSTPTVTNSGKRNQSTSQPSSADIPPPLPQRNPPRKSVDFNSNPFDIFRNTPPVSDLDNSGSGIVGVTSPNNNSNIINSYPSPTTSNTPQSTKSSGSENSNKKSNKKRYKNKAKALSDPKMSTQIFIQVEAGRKDLTAKPPPLPPRQYMLDENRLNNNHFPNNYQQPQLDNGRALPNSIDTVFNYPLVSTCTTVRDNLSPFPFQNRQKVAQKVQKPVSLSGSTPAKAMGQQPASQLQRRATKTPDNLALSTSTHISANKSPVSKLINETPNHKHINSVHLFSHHAPFRTVKLSLSIVLHSLWVASTTYITYI